MSTILVTGASTGIGRATALHLTARGYRVLAGVRRLADAPPGTIAVQLDVIDENQVAEAAGRLEAEDLSGVVNNAGHNYAAAFEHSDEASARRLMEVNFFGLSRVSKAVLPHLRRYAAKHPGETAKLINISSIGGLVGIPWEVFYHASKFAVVGLSEGLRAETWSQNIRTVVICPGGIKTEFIGKTRQELESAIAALPPAAPPSYGAGLRSFLKLAGTAERFGSTPEMVARKITSVLAQRNPAFRQLAGLDAHILFLLSRLLPQSLFHKLIRAQFAPATH